MRRPHHLISDVAFFIYKIRRLKQQAIGYYLLPNSRAGCTEHALFAGYIVAITLIAIATPPTISTSFNASCDGKKSIK